eukprot:1637415-Lingulodinium_polyedra.AAC.1
MGVFLSLVRSQQPSVPRARRARARCVLGGSSDTPVFPWRQCVPCEYTVQSACACKAHVYVCFACILCVRAFAK